MALLTQLTQRFAQDARYRWPVPPPTSHTMLKTHPRPSTLHRVGGEGTRVTDFENIGLPLGVKVKSLITAGFA